MDFEVLLENYKDEIIRTTQDFIKIKSVRGKSEPGMPYGRGPYDALQYMLGLCGDMGFRVKDIDGCAGHAEFGEGNETIGVLVHLDVVPEGEGWAFSPFEGTIHDGKLYGRGAIDDRGPTVAIIYALKILKASGVKLKRKIKVVFGTDEENGFDGIRYYLSKEKAFDMSFTPDARFPLICGEKGILLYRLRKKIDSNAADFKIKSIKGGSTPNMVPDFCKVYVDLENEKAAPLRDLIHEFKLDYGFEIDIETTDNYVILNSKGKTAHASTPEEGLNAISIMMLFLSRLKNDTDDLSRLIKTYNEKIGMKYNDESLSRSYSENLPSKLTLNVGTIAMDEDKFEMTVDVRYPISYTKEQITQTLEKEFAEAGFDMEQLFALDPICFSEDHFLVQKLMKVYKDVTKDQESKPLIIGGATYARAMENVIAFGPVFPDEEELAHKKDEYIAIENLIKLTRIYTHALYELSK